MYNLPGHGGDFEPLNSLSITSQGLGKTVSTICLMLLQARAGPSAAGDAAAVERAAAAAAAAVANAGAGGPESDEEDYVMGEEDEEVGWYGSRGLTYGSLCICLSLLQDAFQALSVLPPPPLPRPARRDPQPGHSAVVPPPGEHGAGKGIPGCRRRPLEPQG